MKEFLILYLLFLKATLTTFSGPTTLPVIRQDFVRAQHRIDDRDLMFAVAIGRITPGPKGNYLIAVGELAAGPTGALAAWLALITPALLVVVLLRWLARQIEHPRWRAATRGIVLGGSGLSLTALIPLAQSALTTGLLIAVAAAALAVSLRTKWESIWIVAASAGVYWLASL